MSTEIKKLDISSIDISNVEFTGFEDLRKEIVQVIEDNPFIEIIDNKTYDEAKKRRTALKTARVKPQNDDKLIASKIQVIRKSIKGKNDELADLVIPYEEKQQDEVARWETIKENERLEKERLEQIRVDTIKKAIEEIETECYTSINKMIFASIDISTKEIHSLLNSDQDFEEFDYNFTLAKTRVETALTEKITSLENGENERLEKIKLQEERDAAEKKARELQAQIDAQNAQIEKERLERENLILNQEKERLLQEKEKEDTVFEVRKNRLEEIGFYYKENIFYHNLIQEPYTKIRIYILDVIDFENFLTDSKNAIQEAKEEYEKQQSEKEAREKAENEAKKKADQENKARVKRLSKDKAIYKKTLAETLGDFPIVFDADQKEIREFSERSAIRVNELYNELLTELENL